MKKIIYFAALLAMPAMAQQTTVATLEDTGVELNEQNYWNGGKIGTPEEGDWGEEIYHCKWQSGLLTGHVDYNYMDMGEYAYDWWGGIALSQRTGTELKSLDDQYNNIVGTGANGSKTFGVIYGDLYTIDVNVKGGAMINSLYVVNSAYTMQNVLVGDGYSAKFQNPGDHIFLNIVATRTDGSTKTAVVRLAEWTDQLEYIKDWTRIGLDSLGTNVTKLTFTFDAHNSGVPLYACIDDIEVVTDIEGPANFENLTLEEEGFWNGTDNTGSFISGGYRFENGYQDYDGYPYCYGFFYTNRTATTYGGYAPTDQYNSAVGHGAENSSNYATYNLNLFDNPKGVEVIGEPKVISGCYLTNNAYAYLSMKNGENFTKKFEKGDWFKLTITGKDANGNTTGSVDFYLADLRSEDEAQQYILNSWKWCDLTSLGAVKRLDFNMSSTDNGDWGMNTPAYFCMDNLGDDASEAVGLKEIVNRKSSNSKWYDLQGRQIVNCKSSNRKLTKGMYIVNGKKVIR